MSGNENYFIFSSSVQNLLFKDLTVSSVGTFIGLCFGIAAFTFLFEVVKLLRHHLVTSMTSIHDEPDASIAMDDGNESIKPVLPRTKFFNKRTVRRLKFHCVQTLLHMMQLAMGYMVMLIVMSYNAWLMITVLLTTAICYYFHDYVISRKQLVVPYEVPAANL